MNWSVIRTIDEWANLKEEWNTLLACSASHVPFLRHEYLTTWWQTLGGGEWANGELCVAVARHADGSLAGAAPFFFTTNRDNEPALMIIGSIEISDYLDLLVCLEDLPEFVVGLLEYLQSDRFPNWQVLDLYNFLDQSPSLPWIEQKSREMGLQFEKEALQHCPYIPLPGDWETYLAGIDKKQRHEIRRKMRRAEEWANEWNEGVRWYIVEDGSSLESEVEGFLELMAQDPDKERFLTPPMRKQMQLGARAVFEAGWLQLAFLEVGGKKAAGYMNFDFDGHIWVYNSGINFNYRELSPGWVLLGNLLQWANEHKRSRFDFMRGDEEYKYRFGGIDRRVLRLQIRR